MNQTVFWAATVLAFAIPASHGRAESTDAVALLAEVDKAANRAKDATMTLQLEVSRGEDEPLKRTIQVWQRGSDQRMVKFVAPARLRGTGILVPRDGTTYLYLPAYRRVRRVAGQEGGGSWMGTGFSIDDLARVRFSSDYTPKITASDDTTWTLMLTPKAPEKHRHASVTIIVRKADHLVARIETKDKDGGVLREIVATDFKTVNGYTVAHAVSIVERKNNRRTSAVLSEVAFDQGIGTDTFTQRELKRTPR